MATVSFCTQCYDKDFKFVLDKERLESSIKNCNYNFNEKIMIVNISSDYTDIKAKCQELIESKTLTHFYLVEDYIDDICKHYEIEERDFESTKTFHINLYNLASIYLSKSDYLVFFTGDTVCTASSNWVNDSIKLFEKNKEVLVTNLEWTGEPVTEHYTEDDTFRYSRMCLSDQNYMARRSDLLKKEIVECRSLTRDFPHGDTFESRLYNYMENNKRLRCIHKVGRYLHKNF